MAASMKSSNPELKTYLRSNKLPDVYEALLTGLAIMCPDDPLQFLLDKLKFLTEGGLEELNWDMFVDEDMRPVAKIITESNLDFIFNLDDESMIQIVEWPIFPKPTDGQPSPEMYHMAYQHYNTFLKNMCYRAWLQYYLNKKLKKTNVSGKMLKASNHHSQRLMKEHFVVWKEWLRYRKGCQAMFFQVIQKVWHLAIARVIFNEWKITTEQAKNQREYFERLERGENLNDEDGFGSTGDARDSISWLDRSVAVRIFKNVDIADLSRCSRVCRSWKVIITNSSAIWNRIDFSQVKNKVTDKVATKHLMKWRPYLIHVNLRGCTKLGEPTFRGISECRNLQDLNLSQCTGVNDDSMKIALQGCKILLYLNVSLTNITDATLRNISKFSQHLQFLSLAYCKSFTDRGLMYLASAKCSKKLEYLDISGCLQITPDGFKGLANGCINLQTLIINDFPTLTDECVIALANKCTKIHTVSVLGSPLLTDESFKKLAQHKRLKKLKTEGNQRISDVAMKSIGQCQGLTHLYITDCQRLTDASLKQLTSCKELRVANFADCVRISDGGVRPLTDGDSADKIRELNLTNCIRVSELSVINMLKKLKHLTYVSLCFCDHISENGIEILGQMHSLTSLDISGCKVTDKSLSLLGNNYRLRDVTLSECIDITDLGLEKFTQQCKEIERLDLSHCWQITDGAIKNLAFCCQNLNALNLCGCKNITNMSIQYLSGVCKYLNTLDISGCLHISDKSLKYLRKGCKKLKSLTMLYCKEISKSKVQKRLAYIQTVVYSDEPVPNWFRNHSLKD
ncbi:F-box and leucine-rich repeat protein 13-like isoform X2 [Mytilus trossulus]|uniref:F-box and leucine-rich repeat protein 13-like isoform X2 n=1 Tax=Mytilus trossulus TaxID=6551 RepID=UPI003005B10E